ncbi:hypothetical protein GTH52_14865 [Clostridium tyrobutyricum]|uniref:CRISPR-associated protein, TM1802 family n=1 Tax=Clostridium tyrobutyricum DIVETGP TaxID=1408889 RepID=W6N8X7_CLOTY|nr:hypothetical protein [Clostridium tyrobutyricum]AND85780.1 hypothetical protein CTK_C25360 [Clostridium tyrobutyricum]ANP70297.1 hypothetical protein BA182_11610 [Clostridium tyrobutyricum]MBR9648010.1 hypothetical protein [Clostridium tyrobutyricum]MBV4416378.1 hypothetical protein [Clostridium tyrobutyricum]MBV4423479.1 hypothetical protein [Clostridium tyrobutyricum]
MINEIYDIFSKIYTEAENGDNLLIDNYTLSPGDYVEFTLEDTADSIEILNVDKNTDQSQDDYKKFAKMDYVSGLISMNKPLDPKKIIHSNSMYTFYVKKENLDKFKGKLSNEVIDGYYSILKNPKTKYKRPKSKELYLKFEEKYGKPNVELIDKIQNWIKKYIMQISEKIDLNKTYLKLFYDTDFDNYKKESERYIIPNIYNNTDYNIKIKNKVYGLPDFNMGLNSKKPYLENKTRKSRLPLLVDSEKISMEKKLFDYLMNYASEGKNYVYAARNNIDTVKMNDSKESNFKGYFFRLNKGKEVEIIDYDSITNYEYKLKRCIKLKPILKNGFGKDFKLIKRNLGNIGELKTTVSEVFFNKYLIKNFFTDSQNIKLNNSKVKEALLKYRYGFYTWFYKGEEVLVKGFWNKMTLKLLCNSINQKNINRAINQFNLRHAVLDYFNNRNEGDKMANTIKNIRKSVDEKINIKKDIDYKVEINSEEEYYFCIGQLLQYFYSLNNSGNKNYSFINPILTASEDKVIKEKLRRLFVKYNYAIMPSIKFRNMYYMILGYEPENEVDKDLIIAGFLCPNLIYKKSEKNNYEGEN